MRGDVPAVVCLYLSSCEGDAEREKEKESAVDAGACAVVSQSKYAAYGTGSILSRKETRRERERGGGGHTLYPQMAAVVLYDVERHWDATWHKKPCRALSSLPFPFPCTNCKKLKK